MTISSPPFLVRDCTLFYHVDVQFTHDIFSAYEVGSREQMDVVNALLVNKIDMYIRPLFSYVRQFVYLPYNLLVCDKKEYNRTKHYPSIYMSLYSPLFMNSKRRGFLVLLPLDASHIISHRPSYSMVILMIGLRLFKDISVCGFKGE